jgi:glycosyltransferase involved in cell wall biosynthesis
VKIAFEAKRIFSNRTGLGNYGRSLIQGLRRFFPHVECLLYTPDIRGDFSCFGQTHEALVRRPGKKTVLQGALWRTFALGRAAAGDKADIFHGLSHELPLDIKKFPGPAVLTVHDLIFLRRPGDYALADRWTYRLKYGRSIRAADHIIAVSRRTARDLVELLHVPEDKISVVYQSCRPEFQTSAPFMDTVNHTAALPTDYILQVGALTRRKNPMLTLEALALMPSSLRPVLVMVGSGPLEKALRARAMDPGLKNHFILRTNVEDCDLAALYRKASALVYPSWYEGFGIPILEALWSRTPVVAAKGSCLEEAGGPDSLYVSPDQPAELAAALERVLTDTDLAAKMIKRGRKHAQNFTPEKTTKDLMDVYNALLS